VSLCLLNEVVTYVEQPFKWLHIFSEHALFANVVQILDLNLKVSMIILSIKKVLANEVC
jgi:hypothetical protein